MIVDVNVELYLAFRDLTITAFSNKYTFFSYILTVGVPKSNGEKIKGGVDIYLGKEGVNGQGG